MRKFLIATKEQYDKLSLDFNQMLSDSPSWSIDGSKCFFKYENVKPSCLSSLTGVLTLEEMKELIRDEEEGWDKDYDDE